MSQRLKEWAMERFPEVFEEEREPTFPPEYEADTDSLEFWQPQPETKPER